MLQDDPAFRDDSGVPLGRMAAAGPFIGRDRRRFRSTQRDACFRLQPCPHPIGEYHVPSALPDPAGDLAGTPSLRRLSVGDLGGRNFGKIPSDTRKAGAPAFPMTRGRGESFSVYIMSKFFRRKNFTPRAILASTRDAQFAATRHSRVTVTSHGTQMKREWKLRRRRPSRRGLLRPWCSSVDLVASPFCSKLRNAILEDAFTNV